MPRFLPVAVRGRATDGPPLASMLPGARAARVNVMKALRSDCSFFYLRYGRVKVSPQGGQQSTKTNE